MINTTSSTREGTRAKVSNEAVRNWTNGLLPTPHLLDATWWFDDDTVAFFHQAIESSAGGAVVCLGAPNVFVHSAKSGLPCKLILIDGDPAVADSLSQAGYTNVITANLMREQPHHMDARLVLADPPWYESEIRAFLVTAQAVAAIGAEILVSIPPTDIRPGIEAERSRIFQWASDGGLELLEIVTCGTRYICPPFEHNALRSSGGIVADNWRFGDLARLRVSNLHGLTVTSPERDLEWQDVCLLNTRFRIANKPAVALGDTRLISIGWPEDIFPSCSRRHPGRGDVDVWTSGNRAFRCKDPNGLAQLARSLRSGDPKEFRKKIEGLCASPMEYINKTTLQLLGIVETEEKEYEAIRLRYV